MHKAGPEPQAVFSSARWTEIAKTISLGSIPYKEKQEICDAIWQHHLASLRNAQVTDETSGKSTRRRVDPRAKGRAALSNFVKYTRGLRHALDSVESYLKSNDLINEAEELIGRTHKFQKLAQRELDKKSAGGRPGQQIRDELVFRLGVIYERLTGKKPTRSVDRNGKVCGPFPEFVYTIFEALGVSVIGLPNAIAKAVRDAKNLQ